MHEALAQGATLVSYPASGVAQNLDPDVVMASAAAYWRSNAAQLVRSSLIAVLNLIAATQRPLMRRLHRYVLGAGGGR